MAKKSVRIIFLLLVGLLLYLLWWRFQVSSVRFFDIDEFAYLHWAGAVARGERPYVDFFSYFTPGFMWVLTPLFWIYGASVSVFTAARTLSLVVFLGILGGLGYLFGITRGWKWALIPVIILAFLPMPYDKFLEIRPDNLAALLVFIGILGEVIAIRQKKHVWWLLAGLLYSASLFVLAKTLPIVLVGAGIAALYLLWDHHDWKKILSSLLAFFAYGLLGPWVVFFFGAWVSGHLSVVWYALTRLPFEVYKSAVNFPMEADLFFFPNASFYGGDGHGITIGLLTNHILWVLAILAGAYRLFTLHFDRPKEAWNELLIGLVFFVSIFGYVKFFPLKHSQYLIPIAVLVAYYSADALASFFEWLVRAGGFASLVIVLFGFFWLVIAVNVDVNTPKLSATNARQLTEISALISAVPKDAKVVDLEGRMVFWPDGYPISALPFDSFLSYVSQPPLSLSSYLTQNPAGYIYQGDSGRINTLSKENLAYITMYFSPVPGFGDRLWKRK